MSRRTQLVLTLGALLLSALHAPDTWRALNRSADGGLAWLTDRAHREVAAEPAPDLTAVWDSALPQAIAIVRLAHAAATSTGAVAFRRNAG